MGHYINDSSVVLNSPSIVQLFIPDLYVGIYIESLAGMTKAEAMELNSGLYQTILLGFQALGLSIFGYLLLSVPVILIPYKRPLKRKLYEHDTFQSNLHLFYFSPST